MVEDALQELEHVVNCVVLIVAGGADSQDAIDENSILSFSLALLMMPHWGRGGAVKSVRMGTLFTCGSRAFSFHIP